MYLVTSVNIRSCLLFAWLIHVDLFFPFSGWNKLGGVLQGSKGFKAIPFMSCRWEMTSGTCLSRSSFCVGRLWNRRPATDSQCLFLRLFYIFDIEYPKQCVPVWQFLQNAVYEMGGDESKPAILACK